MNDERMHPAPPRQRPGLRQPLIIAAILIAGALGYVAWRSDQAADQAADQAVHASKAQSVPMPVVAGFVSRSPHYTLTAEIHAGS